MPERRELGSNSGSTAPPPLSDPHKMDCQKELEIQLGYLYEIDHAELPPEDPHMPVHLRSIRVALVCEKTEYNIKVRFPSKESLWAFFRYSTRETRPTLDEEFVMGIGCAEKVLAKLVPSECFYEQKSLETFWLVEPKSCDHIFKGDNTVINDEEGEKDRKGPKDRWYTERLQLNAKVRNKIDCLLMHMRARANLNIDERFRRQNPERPMEYWVEYVNFVGVREELELRLGQALSGACALPVVEKVQGTKDDIEHPGFCERSGGKAWESSTR